MASSSSCFVVIFMSTLLQFMFVSASTKHIDAICQHVTEKEFCVKSLTAYPPAASATDELKVVKAALDLAKSYAEKSRKFTVKVANENPNLKKQFMECGASFQSIIGSLWSATKELTIDTMTANYDVMVCYDHTRIVKDSIGKNRDEASKTIMNMTMMMDKLLAIAGGATELVL
ncbi:unnamed protein product [Thlaspi arvense]|uniref:Pectinesterase inhibitor domain-containing protein n=1 Tax=Thlaspi arvense TaxID=13288 RepID=A0AAU9T7E1_THLAR|nr:unnamed protein product [Thlaspi arvense]